MKIYFFLILITGIGFSQTTGLSAYGVGEKTHNSDPASLALGNSSFFSTINVLPRGIVNKAPKIPPIKAILVTSI